MAARPTHDLTVKTGEYTDAQGQTKGRWLRIGTVFRHDDGGTSIKLDAIPVGIPGWEGWVNVFPREQQDGQGQTQHRSQANGHQYAQPPTQRAGNDHHNGNGQAQRPTGAAPVQDFEDDLPF